MVEESGSRLSGIHQTAAKSHFEVLKLVFFPTDF